MEEDYFDEVPAQKPRKEKGAWTEKQRKKSYAPAKVAAPIPTNRPPEVFCAPNHERTEYVISSIKSGMSSRFLQLISRMDEHRLSIEIPMNHPLSYQLVIGDIAYLQDGALTDIVERKNLLARYKWDGDRYSLFQRKRQSIAANLDTLVIVASAKNPNFQPGFIDRYMVLAQECGIPPIICITKSDLKPISDPVLDWYEHALGIRVFHTASTTGDY